MPFCGRRLRSKRRAGQRGRSPAGISSLYLLDYFAHLFQRPWEPGHVAVVLRGVGKGFFATTMGGLLGDHFVAVSNQKHLLGDFNAHLRNKLLVFGDEVFGTSEKRVRGILKPLITEREHTIEAKGVDVQTELKYLRLIMASNEG